jgi:hypothetical protein
MHVAPVLLMQQRMQVLCYAMVERVPTHVFVNTPDTHTTLYAADTVHTTTAPYATP